MPSFRYTDNNPPTDFVKNPDRCQKVFWLNTLLTWVQCRFYKKNNGYCNKHSKKTS